MQNSKEVVQLIDTEKANNDSNSRDLARALNLLSKTVFGEVNRFVFELLQNADDSPKNDAPGGVDVEFRLLDNYLIFAHSGKHFDANDVMGISSIAGRVSNKDKDINKHHFTRGEFCFNSLYRTITNAD